MSQDQIQPPTGPVYRPGPPSVPKRSNSCLWIGLIGCGTLLVVTVVLVIVAFFAIKAFLGGMLDEFTDDTPAPLASVTFSEEQMKAVDERVKDFRQALDEGTATEPLRLTADDLNALIGYSEDWEDLKGCVLLSIENDKLRGEISLPLSIFELGFLEDRYLNGSAVFSVALTNGRLTVYAEEVNVKGAPLPPEFMSELRTENLAQEIQSDPEFGESIRKIESIEVKDGAIIITPKRAESAQPEAQQPEAPQALPEAEEPEAPQAQPEADEPAAEAGQPV